MINWKELLYPYEQAVEELLLKFRSLDKECRHISAMAEAMLSTTIPASFRHLPLR